MENKRQHLWQHIIFCWSWSAGTLCTLLLPSPPGMGHSHHKSVSTTPHSHECAGRKHRQVFNLLLIAASLTTWNLCEDITRALGSLIPLTCLYFNSTSVRKTPQRLGLSINSPSWVLRHLYGYPEWPLLINNRNFGRNFETFHVSQLKPISIREQGDTQCRSKENRLPAIYLWRGTCTFFGACYVSLSTLQRHCVLEELLLSKPYLLIPADMLQTQNCTQEATPRHPSADPQSLQKQLLRMIPEQPPDTCLGFECKGKA